MSTSALPFRKSRSDIWMDYMCVQYLCQTRGYLMEGRTSRLRPQATVVPAPLSSAVAIVCPRDPKTETWGLRENAAPPEISLRWRACELVTSAAHARLNDAEMATRGDSGTPSPPPANQTPLEKSPAPPKRR